MVRRLPPRVAALLATACFAMLFAACDGEPQDVALATVVGNEADYDGRTLRLEGVVRFFDDPQGGHIVIEDQSQNRVELLPTEQAEPYVGQQVVVVGRFTFSDETGRRLRIDELSLP